MINEEKKVDNSNVEDLEVKSKKEETINDKQTPEKGKSIDDDEIKPIIQKLFIKSNNRKLFNKSKEKIENSQKSAYVDNSLTVTGYKL